MEKITMTDAREQSLAEIFELFTVSQSARGVAEVTLRNYRYHMRKIAKHLDIQRPMSSLTKRDLEKMVVEMRNSGLKHNSIATYVRMMKTFLNWCQREGFSNLTIDSIKEKDQVKEPYKDRDIEKLLKRPNTNCDFGEYRCWVIVNFLLNSGCRAATVRHIQNCDVDLAGMRVAFRHNKNGRVQTIPLCSIMANILKEYMRIRKGGPQDYLFCDVYGQMLTENGLRHAIARYNKSRGVESTSIHKFRHTFARKYLMDCGGNAFTLQKLMGHSTLRMTKHYCALYDADITKDYDMHSPLTQMSNDKKRISKK